MQPKRRSGRGEQVRPQRSRRSGRRGIDARSAAGLIVLGGILSLTGSLEPFVTAGAPGGILFAGDVRRLVMERDDAIETVNRPGAIATGAPALEAASAAGVSAVWGRKPPSSSYALLQSVESYIQRYPWPTLMLGLGAGYLLSRRMR